VYVLTILEVKLAVPWLKMLVAVLSLRTSGFTTGSVYVGFVVDKVAPGQDLLPFPPVNNIPPRLSILMYYLGMNHRPIRDRSSETHPQQI
jgi:hypothetical protein